MPHVSNDPTQFDYIPEPHRKVFATIHGETMWVHVVWQTYRQLFADEKHVKLINATAPAFGKIIQDALRDDVVLTLCRLTDPPATGDYANLVVKSLCPMVEGIPNQGIVQAFNGRVTALGQQVKILREHRNKIIAHSDSKVSLGDQTVPGYSRQMIEDALQSLRDIMNGLQLHLRDSTTAYDYPSLLGGGDVLMSHLKLSLRYRSIQHDSHKLDGDQLRARVENYGPLSDSEFE